MDIPRSARSLKQNCGVRVGGGVGCDMMSAGGGGGGDEGEEMPFDGCWIVAASGTGLDNSCCDDRLPLLQNHASLTMNQYEMLAGLVLQQCCRNRICVPGPEVLIVMTWKCV